MTISTVGTASATYHKTSYSSNDYYSIQLPSCQEGDIVVVSAAFRYGASGDPSYQSLVTEGYVTLRQSNIVYSSYQMRYGLFYKVMGSTADSSVVVQSGYATSRPNVAIARVFRGCDIVNTMDVPLVVSEIAQASFSNPNSPAITPVSANTMLVTLAIANQNVDYSYDTRVAPTGYGETSEVKKYLTSFLAIDIAQKEWAGGGPDDPGPWTWAGTSNGNLISAITIALRASNPYPSSGEVLGNGGGEVSGSAQCSATIFSEIAGNGSLSIGGGATISSSMKSNGSIAGIGGYVGGGAARVYGSGGTLTAINKNRSIGLFKRGFVVLKKVPGEYDTE